MFHIDFLINIFEKFDKYFTSFRPQFMKYEKMFMEQNVKIKALKARKM